MYLSAFVKCLEHCYDKRYIRNTLSYIEIEAYLLIAQFTKLELQYAR
jgi:hypothetical protein